MYKDDDEVEPTTLPPVIAKLDDESIYPVTLVRETFGVSKVTTQRWFNGYPHFPYGNNGIAYTGKDIKEAITGVLETKRANGAAGYRGYAFERNPDVAA